MSPARVLAWVKLMEVVMQMRPAALARVLAHRDPDIRDAQRWYYRVGRRVWFREVWHFLAREVRVAGGETLEGFWGPPQADEERSMVTLPLRRAAREKERGEAA